MSSTRFQRFDPLAQHAAFLGQTFVRQMNDVEHPVIVIGKDRYTKYSFARVFGLANLMAARKLQMKAQELGIGVMEYFKTWTPTDVAECRGLGHTCMLVLFTIGAHYNIDTVEWRKKSKDVTFGALKDAAFREERKELAEGKKRTKRNTQKTHTQTANQLLAEARKTA